MEFILFTGGCKVETNCSLNHESILEKFTQRFYKNTTMSDTENFGILEDILYPFALNLKVR